MTKILLADDSVTIQKVVELTFSDEESQVTAVGDGASALEKIQLDRPDIILSDVIMPGMNGYELCQKVKSDPNLRSIPFLFLKGTFESFDEEKAQQCGADGTIVKPFESQELVSKVRELVSRSAGAAVAPPPAAPPAPAPAASPVEAPLPAAPPPTPAPVAASPAPQVLPPPAPAEPPAALVAPPAAAPPPVPAPPTRAAAAPAAPPPAEVVPLAAADETSFDLGLGEEEMEGDAARSQEEDLWSEVSLSDQSSPLADEQVLEEESFWGAGGDGNIGLGDAVAAPSGEELLEEVQEPEIHELSEEVPLPPPVEAVPVMEVPLPPAPPTPAEAVPPPPKTAPPGQAVSAVSKEEFEAVLSGKIEDAVKANLGSAISDTARKIIEEVAWEVIPGLAEAMIRSEIEKITRKESGG